MTTTTTTTTILCPLCEGAEVPCPSWSFDQTSIEVPACSRHNADGIVSVEIKVSAVVRLSALVPVMRAAGGLVSMEVK